MLLSKLFILTLGKNVKKNINKESAYKKISVKILNFKLFISLSLNFIPCMT